MTDWFNTPDPSDAPDDERDLLDQVDGAIYSLSEKLKLEPELRRTEATAYIKTTAPECLIFMSVIWPAARELAGLPRNAGKGGRPKKVDEKTSVRFSDGG
jgi:hypothetical protein